MNAWIYYSVYYLIFVPLAFIYTKMFCGWDLKDYGAQFGHKKTYSDDKCSEEE